MNFKKLAAVVCSATTLLAAGAAMSASASGDLMIVGSDNTYTIAELEAADWRVPVTISIQNNPGYCGSGIGIYYGEEINPCVWEDDGSLEYEMGPKSGGLAIVAENNDEKNMIGWATGGAANVRGDGIITTLFFMIPEDVTPGTEYEIYFVIDQIANANTELLEATPQSAWIRIQGETTETTTTTTETTTTTTETTTTTTETTTTTTETTTTTTETTTTTTETTTTETTTAETTTTTAAPEPTGDAGVALAVAGLLTAAGTALVVRKKRG